MSDEIKMKSEVLKVVEILKETKAEMFGNLKVGDKIQMEVTVVADGRGYCGAYAKRLRITNLKTNEYAIKTFNEVHTILKNFKFKAVK